MASNIPYAPQVDLFQNTKEFSYLAQHFDEYGSYTGFTEGSKQYKDFWEQVSYYCRNGFENSKGQRITGIHFFYLNFIKILAAVEGTKKKKRIFPRFLDIDYDYFWCLDYCKKNQKGLLLVKPRRLGFSYKAAAVCTHEFVFERDSNSIISAFFTKFADTTMGMVLDNLNFLNDNTEYRKQRNPDTRDFIEAKFKVNIGGLEVWRGYRSKVRQITFKDNQFAAVGQSADWFIMDEAGVFPNIIEAYNMSEPTIKNGSDYVGVALVFGSAGSMEGGTQYFYQMFMNPSNYNMLEFPNQEEGGRATGWFVSATRGRLGKSKVTGKLMVDDDGNSFEEEAKQDILYEREVKRKGGDTQALKDHVTQYPLKYKDAFLRSSGSIFPVAELQEHLSHIETHKEFHDSGKKVDLYFDETNILKSRLSPSSEEIIDFPLDTKRLKDGVNTKGAIVIYEEPERNPDGTIPFGLYVAGCDPYDHDRAENSTSLGSLFIYKRFLTADKTHDIIVAEYTGRPDLADSFYENCRKLLMFYNAKCLYENMLKGLKVYFEQKHSLHLLYQSPESLKDIVKNSTVTRGYGIHMTKEVKRQAEIYLKQWLIEDREIRETKDGKPLATMNLHTIMNKALLKELIAYDPEEGNFDRVIAFMLCILQKQELYRIKVQEGNLYNKPLFTTDPYFSKQHFTRQATLSDFKINSNREFQQ